MVHKANLIVYSAGKEQVWPCDMTFIARNNSNTLTFETSGFALSICLKDVVDLEDFANLLKGKEKKNILHCTLIHNAKEYKGLRKVMLKNGRLAVSLGGVRIELDAQTKKTLEESLAGMKAKMGL
ncbi:MAG: hypothetical protein ABIJ34_09080 [archaeon]